MSTTRRSTYYANGFVNAIDPATGREVHPCLISVRTAREAFGAINLERVNKAACLRNLGAQVSAQPQALQPVKPIIEFDMVDKRFIEKGDVLGSLDSRPNLMDLTPSEFETLVSNLFSKMGLETKLTIYGQGGSHHLVSLFARLDLEFGKLRAARPSWPARSAYEQ